MHLEYNENRKKRFAAIKEDQNDAAQGFRNSA